MTAVWITIAALTVGTALSKAAGTIILGARELSPRALSVTALLAPAILAALVVYETLGPDLKIDARVAGLAAAVLAIWARAPMIVVIVLAAAVTATVRAFT
jgi:branched-subunit amino acid transport protein